MTKKIFITGGGGLIGNHLILELLQNKDNEISLYCLNKEYMLDVLEKHILFQNQEKNSLKIIEGNVADSIKINSVLVGFDEVYHCAGVVSFWKKKFNEMMQTNVEGTTNIVNSCLEHKVKKLCFVSSIAALGRSLPGKMINEENDWEESKYNSQYAISKMLSEREVWRGVEAGLDAVIINPGLVLGEGNWNSSSSTIFKKLAYGTSFYPQGMEGFVDVKDLVKMMVILMNSNIKNERFIAVSANLPFYELFKIISKNFGKTPPKYKIRDFFVWFIAFVNDIKSSIDGKEPIITYETIKSFNAEFQYEGKKLENKSKVKYTPIDETLKRVCKYYTDNYINQN